MYQRNRFHVIDPFITHSKSPFNEEQTVVRFLLCLFRHSSDRCFFTTNIHEYDYFKFHESRPKRQSGLQYTITSISTR